MRKLLLLGAVAAMAAVAPSFADAQGQGKKAKGIMGQQMLSPGKAGSLLRVGQQLPAGFSNFTPLSRLPGPVRDILPRGMNYVQQGSNVAVVDPTSRIVRQLIPIPGIPR